MELIISSKELVGLGIFLLLSTALRFVAYVAMNDKC